MKQSSFHYLILGSLLLAGAFSLTACGALSDSSPVNAAATEAAATLRADMTQSARSLWTATPVPPTPTRTPTITRPAPTRVVPTPTRVQPTPTFTPTARPTLTPLPPRPTPTPAQLLPTATFPPPPTATEAPPPPASPTPNLPPATQPPGEITPTPEITPTLGTPPPFTPTSTPGETSPAGSTPEPPPTQPPPPAAAPTSAPGEVLLDDDFSVRVWFETSGANFRLYYVDDGYRLLNNYPSNYLSSARSFNLQDVYLETTALLSAGSEEAFYGPACRWQNTHNYYGFGISGSGAYAIFRVFNGQSALLGEGQAQEGRISPVGENDRIAALCRGSQLSLLVNGETLLQVEDNTFQSGQVGLVVLTREGAAEAHFENFLVTRP